MVFWWKKKKIDELYRGAWQYLQKKYRLPTIEKGPEKPEEKPKETPNAPPKPDVNIRYSISSFEDELENNTKYVDRSSVRYSVSDDDISGNRYSIKRDRYSRETVDALMDGAINGRSLDKIYAELEKSMNMTFVEKMLEYINKRGFRDSVVYKAAQIDRRLFSKIVSDRNYKPAKDTCIAIAAALQLDLRDTQDILARAGYTLSHSNKRDVILEYLIREKVYNLNDINEILYRLDQKTLGR